MSPSSHSPALQLVATPIGNLGELCPRAKEALQAADALYCENTPSALRLLTHMGISGKPLKALHEANENNLADEVASLVKAGKNVAYLSEAGVPAISDPGFRLARACRKNNVRVEAIGIPSAFLNALIISGLPTDTFTFYGFPPIKSVGRQKFFSQACQGNSTALFYESCHRLEKSIADLRKAIGPNRLVCLCAELTKLHEFSQTAPLSQIKIPVSPKGEWVIVVAKEGYSL